MLVKSLWDVDLDAIFDIDVGGVDLDIDVDGVDNPTSKPTSIHGVDNPNRNLVFWP